MGIKNNTQYARTVFGSAMHKANEIAMSDKIAGKEVSVHKMHKTFQEEFSKHSSEITVWGDEDYEHFIEQGRKAVNDFYYNFVPILNPTAAEIEFHVDRGKGKLPVVAFADLLEKDTVWDYKYGRSSHPADYVLNMTTYAYCFNEKFGFVPKVKFLCAKWSQKTETDADGVKKKKFNFVKHVVVELKVTENWFQTFSRIYDEVEKGINAEIWLPATDGCGLCKQCGYHLDGHCDAIVLGEE